MGSDEDWFTRVRGSSPASPRTSCTRDFDANEVELLSSPRPAREDPVRGGVPELRGAPDDEAVLCTSDRTFLVKRVETSNTLLVMQPAGGIDRTVVGDAEGEDDRELDPAADGPTPKRRRRDSPRAKAPTPRTAPPPTAPPPPPPRTTPPRSQTSPRTQGLPTSSRPDGAQTGRDVARAVPRRTRTRARTSTATRTPRGPPPSTTPSSAKRVSPIPRADSPSTNSTRSARVPGRDPSALDAGPAFGGEDGRWRASTRNTSNTPWTSRWSPRRGTDGNWAPSRETPSRTRSPTDFQPPPPPRRRHVCARAAAAATTTGVTWSVDAAKLCAAKASRVLDEAPTGGGGGSGAPRWRLDAFLERWRSKTPEDARGGCVEANLRGLALVEKAADGGGGFVRVPRGSTPRNLKERFAAIFAAQAQMDPGGVGAVPRNRGRHRRAQLPSTRACAARREGHRHVLQAMRRERVTGAEVGEEKETARRGEELRGGREEARRERWVRALLSFIRDYRLNPFSLVLRATGLVDRTARGPYRSWTVPLTHHSFRVTLRHTRVGGRGGPDLHRSVVRTRRDRVCLLRCHATQFTSSSCAPPPRRSVATAWDRSARERNI